MNNTVLITGGLGYVGGRIARALTQQTDYNIVVTTRGSNTTLPAWLSRGRVVSLSMPPENGLKEVCQGIRYIVHCAATNEIVSAANPEEALLINGLGTLRLLRAAEEAGVEKFVYFSTAHIYGAPLTGVINEKTLPKPVHPYAITHKVAEDFVLAAHAAKKIIGIVFRLSNGFGAPAHPNVDRWTLLVNDLCRQAVQTSQLVLKTPGTQKRDFITLEDVSRAVLHVLELPADKATDGLFNIGGDNVCRIVDMANLISARYEAVWGSRLPVYRPSPTTDDIDEVFEYQSEKFKRTGFSLKSAIEREIDETLLFCAQAFGRV